MEKSIDFKSDGLEITSIGVLYHGPLDKKYWSSSRGRDRYPYPIGYQAVRITNRGKFRVEIHEGIKGPLFMIHCSDGRSCTGQTPDIACEILQKKGLIHIKMPNEKRSMSKIDGVEFFGFKNPFLQRLFRELVTNANIATEQNLLTSNFCNDALDVGCPDSIQNTKNFTSTQRRPNHLKHKNSKELPKVQMKKTPFKNTKVHNVDDSYFEHQNYQKESQENFASPTVREIEHNTQNQCSLSYPFDIKTSFDRLKDDTMVENTSSISVKTKDESEQFSHDGVSLSFSNLFAPDTGVFSDSDPYDIDKSRCNVKEDSVKEEDVDHRVHDSEGTTYANIMDSCSGKNDSCDQDFTNAMMSVLLPQALPLLKYSRKRKKVSAVSLTLVRNHDEFSKHSIPMNLGSNDGMHPEILQPDLNISETEFIRTVIPDSLENEKYETLVAESHPCFEPDQEAAPAFQNDDLISTSENIELLNGVDCYTKPSVDYLESQGHFTKDVPTTFQNLESDKYIVSKLNPEVVFHTLENKQSLDKTEDGEASGIVSAVAEFDGLSKLSNNCHNSFSESIILRNLQNNNISVSEDFSLHPSVLRAGSSTNGSLVFETDLNGAIGVPPIEDLENEKTQQLHPNPDLERNDTADTTFCVEVSHECDEKNASDLKNNKHCDIIMLENCEIGTETLKNFEMDDRDGIHLNSYLILQSITEFENEVSGTLDILGYYVHPFPVIDVLLSTKEDEISICSLCEHTSKMDIIMFFYKVSIKGQQLGLPTFIGHMSASLTHSPSNFENKIGIAAASLQFTPDARYFVIGNKIKVPCCREQRIDCSCLDCNSGCYEENSLRIIQIERGYASIVKTMIIYDGLVCFLVCGPDHLVIAGENGSLHLWVMDLTWREKAEEFLFPTSLCINPYLSELKKVPKCNSLIVGHNSYGEFGIWDVLKRVMVSRFTSPSNSYVSAFLPVGAFNLDMKRGGCANSGMGEDDQIDSILNSFHDKTHSLSSPLLHSEDDTALCILLRSVSVPDSSFHPPPYTTSTPQWRLGLLANNMLFLGSPIDPRAAVVGAAQGRGLIGTSDGRVYLCDIATGAVPGTLHRFKGGEVSCIAVDSESWPHPVAISGDSGRLLIYTHVKGFNKHS